MDINDIPEFLRPKEETINQRIRRYRLLSNMTQTDVAEHLGIKCAAYSQMERSGNVSTDRIVVLARLFNVDISTLILGDEEYKPTRLQQIPSNPFELNLTDNEETIIRTMRQLPRSVRKEIEEFIAEKYKENKSKRQYKAPF